LYWSVYPEIRSLQIGKGNISMKKIFVGNLSFGATEQSVRSLFEAHGTVESVSIVTDRDTGQPRGFGFVEMSNNSEAEAAIAALNGTDLDGRTLNVNEARPKTDRGFGGGGGGYRGGGGGGNRSGGGGGGGGFGRKQSRW
jgi:cold-inducible RNA-binding protein